MGEETEMKRNVHWNGSRRGWLTLLILLVVIPATIYLCYRAGGRVYYLASVLIILYTMVPFFRFSSVANPRRGNWWCWRSCVPLPSRPGRRLR